ncbi:hypothetical protein BG000_003064 [Podila horticola]|nr:hypothetical protein BG000_003064 [Podila horticola]
MAPTHAPVYSPTREEAYNGLKSLTDLQSHGLFEWQGIDTPWSIGIFDNHGLQLLYLSTALRLYPFQRRPDLHRLTDLTLDSPKSQNPGLAQLIRYCPNRISFLFMPNSTELALKTARSLKECCPGLSHVRTGHIQHSNQCGYEVREVV